jgi:soluble lytic murein transglycosylase-like protein
VFGLFLLMTTAGLIAGVASAFVPQGKKKRPVYVPGLKLGPAPQTVRGLTSEIVALAQKWGKVRGLPTQWILATILVESSGNPNAKNLVGNDRSYGLMQVNMLAHGDRLAQYGVDAQKLLEPDTNIGWGSLILREAYDAASKLAPQVPTIPLATLTRLVYNAGAGKVGKVIAAGGDPRSITPQGVANWNKALAALSG